MNNDKYHLIYNNLKILIDPQYFADEKMIESQIGLVTMLHSYLDNTEPSLCDVIFYYPKYIEERINSRRVFNSLDVKIVEIKEAKKIVNFFDEKSAPDESVRKINNELLSLAVENKIPFILSSLEISQKQSADLLRDYNVTFIKHEPLQDKIKAFLQGFYNYYKFDLLNGVDSPDIAHAMSDGLHTKMTIFENKVKQSELSDTEKERIRSFVHNRYIDILVTVDKIIFYKVQQQISDMERDILDNKNQQFHGAIRYYLNYYLLLLWGYVDHMCIIINNIFSFGFNEEISSGRRKIGFKNYDDKKEFLNKLKNISEEFYDFVVSTEFQEWLDVLGQLRHKNAHKEMISPAPLLKPTAESEISDEKIDEIIYRNKGPLSEELVNFVSEELLENQKILDRHHYKISKMKKLLDHVAIVKNGFLDPVARIDIDMENIKKLTELFLESAEQSDIINNSEPSEIK